MVQGISNLVSRFGGRGSAHGATSGGVVEDGRDGVFPTRALASFLDSLRDRDAPVVLDLGAVVGANVTFLGEQLGCKLLVEDLFVDLERSTETEDLFADLERSTETEDLFADLERSTETSDPGDDPAEVRRTRLAQEDATVDGVLCWDVLEQVGVARGQALADELTRILRPGGALLVTFNTETRVARGHTRYEIVDRTTLRHRFCAGSRGQDRVLQSREVTRMFKGLAIADSFLLTHRMREMLFRKAGH